MSPLTMSLPTHFLTHVISFLHIIQRFSLHTQANVNPFFPSLFMSILYTGMSLAFLHLMIMVYFNQRLLMKSLNLKFNSVS